MPEITVPMLESNTAAQNQAAWNTAISSAQPHDRIIIPPGYYACDPISLSNLHSMTVDFFGSLHMASQPNPLVSFETIERSRIRINGLAVDSRDWNVASQGVRLWGVKTSRIEIVTCWDFTEGIYCFGDNVNGSNEANHIDCQSLRDNKRGLSIKNGTDGSNNASRFTGQVTLSGDVQSSETEAYAVYFDPDYGTHPYIGWTLFDCVVQRHIHVFSMGGVRYGSLRNNYIEDCDGLYYQNLGPYCRVTLSGNGLPDDKHRMGLASQGLTLHGEGHGINLVSHYGGITFTHPMQPSIKSLLIPGTLYQRWGSLVDVDGNNQKLDGLHGGPEKYPDHGTFGVGARWWRRPPVSGQPIYVTCIQAGTEGELDGTTGTVSAGSRTVDLDFAGATNISDFRPGHMLLVGGEGLVVDHVIDGDSIYMTSGAASTHTGAAVQRRNCAWQDGPVQP